MKRDHFAAFFKQEEFSDVDLVIRLPDGTQEAAEGDQPAKRTRGASQHTAGEDNTLLALFPAHRVVLAGTDYFKAQVGEAL
jgi:hypothetical protein